MDKQELISSVCCALTHDIMACEECRKCGKNGADVRINLMNTIVGLIRDLPDDSIKNDTRTSR